MKTKGGGTLEALAAVYLETPKRTKMNVAEDNISRLRSICRLALGRELSEVTCREVGPDLWQGYHRAAHERAGLKFDLATRYRENIRINAAVRAARCLFLPQFIRAYRASKLDVRADASQAVTLPEPYVPPVVVDDATLCAAWAALEVSDFRMWLVVGLARFAGLRREEIAHASAGWIEIHKGVVHIELRDRPEEQWWTKTGKPYRAQVISPKLSAHLSAIRDLGSPQNMIVPDPPNDDRARWFQRVPQAWLRKQGVNGTKPLHRLRGLYADEIAILTADAVTARLAAIRAAQEALGHTTSKTTEDHYLSRESLR